MHDATNKRQTTQKKEKEEEKKSGTDTECCGESSKQKARERNAITDLVQKTEERQRANGPQTGVVHKPVQWRRCRASSK